MMKKLAKALASLARNWWQVDQVRISPSEGRLLNLQPPCYLRIGAQTVEIIQRRPAEQRLGVIYDCADDSQLQVNLISLNRALDVCWIRQDQTIELAAADVEVFSGKTGS
ncbi:MAG: hypothetical protein KDK04_13000 [Candidatus Competibacteraceae bacterium]|nr:hypothetical protein [Candidatus Competibacteraceae bacterium]MCB1812619.1 hypothetical protein [Candidatus Competibacteraceae bacterium]